MGVGGGLPRMRPLCRGRPDNVLHSERGELFRRCPATGAVRPMAFQGLEAKRDALKHRCPAAAYGLECQGRERCSEAAGVAPDGFGRTLRVRLRRSGGRILTPLPRSSPTWARRYAERSALERVNARLDDGFRFERHAVRGKDRMAAKVGLAPAAPTSPQNLTAQLSRSCTCG